MDRQSILTRCLIVIGVVALCLGAVGVVLPLLPTTPFLLLAAGCFMRSSDRLYRWLVHNRWLGDYIRNYREHHAMTRRAKVVALVMLWGAIGYSAVAATASWWLRVLLGVVASSVTAHLLCLKTRQHSPCDTAGDSARKTRCETTTENDIGDLPAAVVGRAAAKEKCL